MRDKYVKAIKDEIKGRMKSLLHNKSWDAQVMWKTYQHTLDLIEHYERKDARLTQKENALALDKIKEAQADAVYDCDMELVRTLDKVADKFRQNEGGTHENN